MLTTVYSSTLLNITQPSESHEKESYMFAVSRKKCLNYRKNICQKNYTPKGGNSF